jgi:tetratricopeptide (TPR) repeat protein
MPVKPLICATAILLSEFALQSHATDPPAKPGKSAQAADPIEQLVAQLGSDDFTERRDAEAELLQLGTATFDYLQAAQSDPDLEIATQSQYLLYRVPIDWVLTDDPAEVRDLMTNYAGVNARERRDIITQLAALEDGMGLAALSRIAHYDMSPVTAKYAAIGVLNTHDAHAKSALSAAKTIAREIGESPRDSARWLRLYATQLKNLRQVDSAWTGLIADETAQLGGEDRTTNSRLILGLLQFHVKLSQKLGDNQALFEALQGKVSFLESQAQSSDANAIRVISRMLDKHDVSALDISTSKYSRWIEHDALLAYALTSQREAAYPNLALTLAWVLDNREWGVLPLLEKQYEKEIKADRLLLYIIAATRAAADQPDEAAKMADRAFELVAFDLDERNQLGEVIADLGYHDWAEREWRYVIDEVPITSLDSMKARRSIANWCLHDRGEDKAAADLLGEVCDAVDRQKKKAAQKQPAPNGDPDAPYLDETGRFYVNALRTQREYFLACHLESEGDYAGQQQHLEAAFRLDHEDPDVLIAMFRLKEADDIYREKVAGRIRRAVDNVEQRIESDSEEPMWYNHYAWLVGNTQGDFDKAVRYSLRSLELCPNTPSYLDTLGRCYYAAGDLENAIKYQRQAVAMHPRVNVMQKQLEMFEKALAKKTK